MRLERICRKWQKRLGLVDWHITIRWARAYEVGLDESEATVADIDIFAKKRTAEIRVLDRRDLDPKLVGKPGVDVETSVVHELLHIWFDPLGTRSDLPEPEDAAREQAIDAISRALVKEASCPSPRSRGRASPKPTTR